MDRNIEGDFLIEPGEVRRLALRYEHDDLTEGVFSIGNPATFQIVEVRSGGKKVPFSVVDESKVVDEDADEDACRAFRRVEADEVWHIFVKNIGGQGARFRGKLIS
jgi:hypothetical protein